MTLSELLTRVCTSFAAQNIDSMLIGGMAVAMWVEPRSTDDCDMVVKVTKRYVTPLKQALIAAGARVTALEMRWLFERPWIRLKTAGPKLDLHRCLTPHDRAAFERGALVEREGMRLRIATPEDLILYKLQAWRPHDRADIHELLVQVKDQDRRYIESWLDQIARATSAPMRDRWADSLRGL